MTNPKVKLLLNGYDVPNQVMGRKGRITISTDPPLDELRRQHQGYDVRITYPVDLIRIAKSERYRFSDAGPKDEPLAITAELFLGDKFQESVTKYIYVLMAINPTIKIAEAAGKNMPFIVRQGDQLHAQLANVDLLNSLIEIDWSSGDLGSITYSADDPTNATITADRPGRMKISAALSVDNKPLFRDADPIVAVSEISVEPRDREGGPVSVVLQRASAARTGDEALWSLIRFRTGEINSSKYIAFVNRVLCERDFLGLTAPDQARVNEAIGGLKGYGTSSYEVLKFVSELFLLTHCGTYDLTGIDLLDEAGRLGENVTFDQLRGSVLDYLGKGNGRLPYLDRVIQAAFPTLAESGEFFCGGLISSRVQAPCFLELIWSYWHEEAMLVQAANAVSRRFQNARGPGQRDPLAHFELDPLRPLNNILWGYIQDEWNRLSVQRRAYEYDHQYGFALVGRAVPQMRTADSRSKFLEAFHSLLNQAYIFFKEDSDTTVIADGYPLLNALKEVHMILAQGAHNQFGDLPWTARVEMLIQQWMFARPEMRDFLQSRPMVPYKEPWMPQVDTMKTLQGWSDVSVTHFSDLAIYGEQILLSVRYGDWIAINDENSAKNWARYWRPEVQGYIHAYRAVAGVDLTNPDAVDATLPAIHLHRRLALQHTRGAPPLLLQGSPSRARPILTRPRY